MSVHRVALGGVAFALLAGPFAPIPPRTTKYKIESKSETTVDLSSFGQPQQKHSIDLVSWVAVTVSDTVGGRIVHVVVDSMKYTGQVPMISQATADSTKGGFVHGFVDPGNRVKNISSRPDQNALLGDVQGVIHSLFPRMKPGVKAGDRWTDTLEVSNTTAGANLTSKFAINYTAGAPTTVGGAPALRVTSVTTAGVTGTMENPMAGTMEVTGTINGSSDFLVGTDGRFLGGSSKATSDQTMKMSMAPAPIPLKVVRSVSVTLIP